MVGSSTPKEMKENKNYVRKRIPINFTMNDLVKDSEENEDEAFISHVQPNTSRSVPKRNCKKKIVYHDGEVLSEADSSETELN